VIESSKYGLSTFNELYTDCHFSSQSHFYHYTCRFGITVGSAGLLTIQQGEHCFYNLERHTPDSRYMVILTLKYIFWWSQGNLGKWGWHQFICQHLAQDLAERIIWFKTVHRLHYSKAKIHKIYPTVSPICDLCQGPEGSWSHSFILGNTIRFSLLRAIFGYSDMDSYLQLALMLGMVVAKRIILRVIFLTLKKQFPEGKVS